MISVFFIDIVSVARVCECRIYPSQGGRFRQIPAGWGPTPRVPGSGDLASLRRLKTAGAGPPGLARAPCPAGKRALRATARA